MHRFADGIYALTNSSANSRCSSRSTPHAPRILHRPLRLNQTTASAAAGGGGTLSVSQPVTILPPEYSPQTKPCNIQTESDEVPTTVKNAWETTEQEEQVLVHPFRRRTYRNPPQCIPCLNLSELNKPDHLMQPVMLLPAPPTFSATNQSSCRSWGVSRMSAQMKDEVEELMDCEDEDQELNMSVSPSSSMPPSLHNQLLERSQLDFIEDRILSYERTRPNTTYNTSSAPPNKISRDTSFHSEVHPGQSLANKLQFEARIATQNGRDIHRQLCGFFFLDDSSITIYEFRQFGKKYSALPLIRRGIYHVCCGRKKGTPYKISAIRKGATLQFASSQHADLPPSLTSRSVLYIRITVVNEQLKQQLLCAGCRPDQRRERLTSALMSPLSPCGVKDQQMLTTMQGMFCNRLAGRASMVLVGLGRHLNSVAVDRVITFNQLQHALRTYHISLTTEDMTVFWHLLQGSEVWSEFPEGLGLDLALHALAGIFLEDTIGLVRQIFMKLDVYKSGCASVDQMKKFFTVSQSEVGVWQDMATVLHMNTYQSISYSDFEHYHLGLRIDTVSDSKFINKMKTCWGI